MGKSQVIAKLTRPATARVLHRLRLFELICPKPEGASTVFIHAPGGAGKTALAASYAEHVGAPALWYQVDSTDADPASLFYHLKLVASALCGSGASRLPLLAPEFALGVDAFARRFFRQFYSLPGPRFTLVFDNCHEVAAGSAFFDLLRVAADELPSGGQLLMLSRNGPPPAFAKLRVDATLVEIDAKALTLTREEARALARQLERGDLSADEVDRLSVEVGAWVAGFVMALRARPSRDSASDVRDEPSRLLFDYFSTEALRGIQQADQALLFRLAVLPWMTPESATALTGAGSAALLLESLAKELHFTTRLGGPKPVFRFHALFREFLLRRGANLLSHDEQRELRLLAAQLMERDGAVAEAFDLAVQGQGWSQAGAMVLRNAPALIAEGRHKSLAAWLGALPAELVEGDAALSRWAGAALLPADPEAALSKFRHAYQLALSREDMALVVYCWAGIVDAIFQGFRDFTRIDDLIDEFDARVEQHLDRVPMADRGRVIAGAFLALVFRRPNHPKVEAWRWRVRVMSRLVPDRQVRHLLRMELATSYLWRGELDGAHDIVLGFGPPGDEHDTDPAIAIVAALTRSSYYLHSGEHEACIAAAQSGMSTARQCGLHLWDSTLCGAGVASCLGAGKPEQAHKLLELMIERQDEERVISHSQMTALQAWYDLATGKPEGALARIEVALESITRGGVPYFRGICLLMAAEVHVCCGHLDEARDFVGQVAETLAATGNAALEWFGHLMTARIAQASGDGRGALAALSTGLRLGSEHGYLHFYFWPRDTLSDMFGIALEHGIETGYVHQLIARNKMLTPAAAQAHIAWPWPVKVYTMGGFRIEIDGKPLAFTGKVQKAPLNLLKALIALGGENVAEHLLEEALWPEAQGDAARQALATTLNRLRKLIGADVILRQGGLLSLNRNVAWCDAVALLSLLGARNKDSASVLSAIELLYRGRFLVQDEDHAWVLPLRDQIDKSVVSAILGAARFDTDAGRHDEAIALCKRGIEIDGLCESFYEIAMRSLVATGRNADAVRLYRQCQRELSTRLRVVPSPATQRAYMAALEPAPALTELPPVPG